ncbi:MAG: AAA domain-containing protein [Actinomycetota bacterium]
MRKGSRPDTREHRLLRYYVDCVEAEGTKELVLRGSAGGDRYILLESGTESVLTTEDGDWREVVSDAASAAWARKQGMSSRSERLLYGYPIVQGRRDEEDVIAPLLFAEVELKVDGDKVLARPQSALIETSLFALDLLGLDRQERSGVLEELEALEAPDTKSLIMAKVALLGDMGLIPADRVDELRPDFLQALDAAEAIANAAVIFVGERALMTRQLLDDLSELEQVDPSTFQSGPLGVLLGMVDADLPPAPEPQPSILLTNLSQDHAIASALQRTFTVVTGPPGTGKSQVLVNAVAAAVDQGDSVLFASKNNKAVDVVFERLSAVSAEAAPLRVGAAARRGNTAQTIRTALSRSRSTSLSLSQCRSEWAQVRASLASLYETERKRMHAERAVEAAEKRHQEEAEGLPPHLLLIDNPAVILEALGDVRSAQSRFHAPLRLPLFRRRRRAARVAALEVSWERLRRTLPAGVQRELATDVTDASVVPRLERACAVATLKKRVNQKRIELGELRDRWEVQEEIRNKDDERVAAGRRLFEAHWMARIRSGDATIRSRASAYADGLERLAQGGGGSAGKLRSSVGDLLQAFPVWGVTNLSARTNLPLTPGMFDLVIIDEASQCDIASAIPLLLRAKRALIIGDRNQLIHVSTLQRGQDEALAKHHGISDEDYLTLGYRLTSLFGLAARRVGEDPLFLEEHYRSHRSIITFSNDLFYGSRLVILTDQGDVEGVSAVRWVDVRGSFSRGPRGSSVVNKEEVNAVAEVATELSGGHDLSLGIVTPYRAQVEAIRGALQRIDFQNLTADTAHRFQGDERDIVVFSPAVSASMPPHYSRFANDPNLVNVGVTRARRQLVIVGDRAACRDLGGVLGHLAKYVTDLEEGPFESPIERRLYEALKEAGIESHPGYRANGFRLDLAIIDDSTKLDIECDGAAFHQERRRDAIRDARLQEAGWSILRFSGRQINQETSWCVERVKRTLL